MGRKNEARLARIWIPVSLSSCPQNEVGNISCLFCIFFEWSIVTLFPAFPEEQIQLSFSFLFFFFSMYICFYMEIFLIP